MADKKNYYDILGVAKDATPVNIGAKDIPEIVKFAKENAIARQFDIFKLTAVLRGYTATGNAVVHQNVLVTSSLGDVLRVNIGTSHTVLPLASWPQAAVARRPESKQTFTPVNLLPL